MKWKICRTQAGMYTEIHDDKRLIGTVVTHHLKVTDKTANLIEDKEGIKNSQMIVRAPEMLAFIKKIAKDGDKPAREFIRDKGL